MGLTESPATEGGRWDVLLSGDREVLKWAGTVLAIALTAGGQIPLDTAGTLVVIYHGTERRDKIYIDIVARIKKTRSYCESKPHSAFQVGSGEATHSGKHYSDTRGTGRTGMPSTVSINEPHPSQLYIDASRLRTALEWFDCDDPTYDPIPVLDIEGKRVLSDGHTRAFIAYLSGAETLEIVHDSDRQGLDLPLYRECLGWCREESVTQIADLAGRVVSREAFLDQWVARCEAASATGKK